MRLTSLACSLFAIVAVRAQTPPAAPALMEYTGKPMRIPFQCTEDDLHTFGLTCPPEHPCAVYLELDGLDAVGDKLFLAGNLHAENTTLSSILLASNDGGKTWREPHERIRGAGLEMIQFIDFENGWIGGQSLGAAPRDPFLLLTNDGGKTWRSRPVFGDGREGGIDYFHFDSKTHGMMWIDRSQSGESESRYETYESMTGGESWMIRETSDHPLRKGPKPPGLSDWRLHTDPATKSYRLEKRAGAGWTPTAAFIVHAGDCREAEPKFESEPPAPAAEEPDNTAAPASPDAPKQKPPSLRKPRS
jgi:hypothetical protein